MSSEQLPSDDDLSPTELIQVNRICDLFEAAWQVGSRPAPEDHLGATTEPLRSALLRELLVTELECRQALDEKPALTEYRARFPDQPALVEAVFSRLGLPSTQPAALKPATPDTGRNLLLGLLALQNNFIDRDALLAAFNVWVTDKSRTLGEILRERGVIDDRRQSLLDALVAEHLKQHGNDPEKSLASLTLTASTRESLKQVGDPDLDATLTQAGSASATINDDTTALYGVGMTTADGRRFRVLRPHARGGLGTVFVAIDGELNREVALKEIQDRHADDLSSRARFVLEAEITGGLEHPGIVPVYGLGTYADGRPYYAMRFIRGDSLKDAIVAFHADPNLTQNPGARSLELRKLLRRFQDVCNAIDYAHSRGVLHRDIKPANVIVGKYGETLVVDWGLAKPTGHREPTSATDERTLRPSSIHGNAPTMTGEVMGTPAFMSPEQAAGDLARLGPQSDVYSLGATLFYLLTGRPPVTGSDPSATISTVREGKIAPPRSLDPSIDHALEAVCLKALALRPENRFATARLLSEDIERWLADEPVTAYREPWTKRLGRWSRRHKTSVAAVMAMLITAVVGLATSTMVIAGKQAETDEARQLAESNFRKASDAVDRMLSRVGGDLLDRRLADVEQVRRDLLEDALAFQQQFLQERPRDPKVQHDLARARLRVADIRNWLGKPREAEAEYRAGIAELERLSRSFPNDPTHRIELAKGYHNFGNLLWSDGRLQDGEAAYRRAIELQQILVINDGSLRADLANYLNTLGTALEGLGKADDMARAEELFRSVEQMSNQLIVESPKESKPREKRVSALANLAILRKKAGDLPGAESYCKKAIEVQDSLVKIEPDRPAHRAKLAKLHGTLGNILQSVGQTADAEREDRQAIEDQEKLVHDFPSTPQYRYDLASSMVNLSRIVMADNARSEEAERLVRRGLKLFDRLVTESPGDPTYRNALVITYSGLGGYLMPRQRAQDAEKAFIDAEKVLEATPEEQKKTVDYRANLGMIQHNLAEALRAQKRFEDALAYYNKAVENQKASLDANPNSMFSSQSLSDGYWAIAETWLDLNRHADAAASAEKMLPLFPRRWEEPFYAAELLGKCAGQAKDDARLSQVYADRAMELLRMARDRGYNKLDSLQTNPALAPLRDRADFKHLIDDVPK